MHVPHDEGLLAEAQGLTDERNHMNVSIEWQFRNLDAWIKLKRLYPFILV